MGDVLLQLSVDSLCVATGIALVAWLVGRTGKFPRATHFLWLMVLMKLVTPSIVSVPILPAPAAAMAPVAEPSIELALPDPMGTSERSQSPSLASTLGSGESATPWHAPVLRWAVWGWLLGSALVLLTSLVRIVRFSRHLRRHARVAPPDIQARANSLAAHLALRACPRIYTVSARVSPFLWCVFGRPRIVLPAELSQRLDKDSMQWILAHELAHMKRRDHWVRILEWCTCVLWWWNPVAALARRGLRTSEEICCDALVISRLQPTRKRYADSLLAAVQFVTAPAVRVPRLASAFVRRGSLERRFKMIVSGNAKPTTRLSRVLALLVATLILPLGPATAEDEGSPGGDTSGDARHERSLADQFEQLGIPREAVLRARLHLRAEGLSTEQAQRALGVSLKLVRHMRRQEVAQTPDDRMRARLREEIRLTAKAESDLFEVTRHFATIANNRASTEAQLREASKAFRAELAEAVKKGDLTQTRANRKWEEYEQLMKEHFSAEPRLSGNELARVKEQLRRDVREGTITEAEARAHLERYRAITKDQLPKGADGKRLTSYAGRRRIDMASVRERIERIQNAVKHGAITEEQARSRWEDILKLVRSYDPRFRAGYMVLSPKEGPDSTHLKLRSFYDMTEDMKGLPPKKGGASVSSDGRSQKRHPQAKGPKRPPTSEEMIAGMERRLEHAVHAGSLTREEANVLLQAFTERLHRSSPK